MGEGGGLRCCCGVMMICTYNSRFLLDELIGRKREEMEGRIMFYGGVENKMKRLPFIRMIMINKLMMMMQHGCYCV